MNRVATEKRLDLRSIEQIKEWKPSTSTITRSQSANRLNADEIENIAPSKSPVGRKNYKFLAEGHESKILPWVKTVLPDS